MKPIFLSIISVLFATNVVANEEIELEIAPASWVYNLYQDCLDLQADEEAQSNSYTLSCVNEQLADAGYQVFKNFSDLKSTTEKED